LLASVPPSEQPVAVTTQVPALALGKRAGTQDRVTLLLLITPVTEATAQRGHGSPVIRPCCRAVTPAIVTGLGLTTYIKTLEVLARHWPLPHIPR